MKKSFLIIVASALLFASCEVETELDVLNYNSPGYNQVLSNANDLENILGGAFETAINIQVTSTSLNFMLQADQLTTTNNSRDFWQSAFQPRRQFVNSPGSSNPSAVSCWNRAYDAIRGANHVIRWIEGENKPFLIDDQDKSQEALASAYFVKAMAEGSISNIYDKGYIVNWDSTLDELQEQRSAADVLAKSIQDFDKAIAITEAAPAGFSNDYMINITLDKARFLQVINSFAARTLISGPSTKAEALNTDFTKVLAYANKGMTTDFMITTKVGVWWSSIIDWAAWYYARFDSAYLQADIKIQHLMDSNYPKDYPDTGILAPAVTTDPRGADYFTYGTSFGFLNAARDRSLFSNYRSSRWNNATNSISNDPNYDNPLFLKAEIDFIKAEATLKTAGAPAAAAILNSSVRNTVGLITTGSTYAEVMRALHYEYAVELQLSGSAYLAWSFMKRNDLLQKGTNTLMPIPAGELEAQGISEVYTFGGQSSIGSVGTASTDGWKNDASYNQ